MNFHPKKCKVLSILHKPSPLCMLPFIAHYYTLGESTLDYTDCEKDLGVDISNNLSFNEHYNKIMSTAKQKLGLLWRTCCFVNDTKRRRGLYLTLVRSQFEHCSQIWHPNNVTLNEKFESIHKKCLKWVLFEKELSYSCKDVYLQKCMHVKLLPLANRFIFNDIFLFHKIFNNLMPVQMPDYLSLFSFNEHYNRIMSTAKHKLGLLWRTCCFVNDTKRRRGLYLTLVRSQFEHCSQIWHPNNVTLNEKFESIQKKCLKWVLFLTLFHIIIYNLFFD